jgi:hypothetical protein
MRVGIMLTTSGLESALEQWKLGNPLFGRIVTMVTHRFCNPIIPDHPRVRPQDSRSWVVSVNKGLTYSTDHREMEVRILHCSRPWVLLGVARLVFQASADG